MSSCGFHHRADDASIVRWSAVGRRVDKRDAATALLLPLDIRSHDDGPEGLPFYCDQIFEGIDIKRLVGTIFFSVSSEGWHAQWPDCVGHNVWAHDVVTSYYVNRSDQFPVDLRLTFQFNLKYEQQVLEQKVMQVEAEPTLAQGQTFPGYPLLC